jgi:hypothetical protein
MKVRELIETLNKMGKDTELYCYKHDMERGAIYEKASFSIKVEAVKEITQEFVDAFDYIRYVSTVLRRTEKTDQEAKAIAVISIY